MRIDTPDQHPSRLGMKCSGIHMAETVVTYVRRAEDVVT